VIAWIGARVADALHHAHELRDENGALADVVHRDVNPSNVFLSHSGDPKGIDFGFARARDRIGSTAVGVLKGKLAYLSPEPVAGRPADRRSDVLSLGITLWELSVGRRLFRDETDVATVQRVLAAEVPDPATLVAGYPEPLAQVIRRALARDPMARWANAGDLARALDGVVAALGRPCDASVVARLLADLFPPDTAPAWEKLVVDHGSDRRSIADAGRMRVWDEDAQKMTWVAASAETMVAAGSDETSAAPRSRHEELDEALAVRIAVLEKGGDAAALARAELERSILHEQKGDRTRAIAYAERAVAAHPSAAAHAVLRRLLHARGAERALVHHLDAEIAATARDEVRADLLAERGRLLAAAGERAQVVAETFERALAHAPGHPAASNGLEAALAAKGDAGAELASHLRRMAETFAAEPKLAAWLHVEVARPSRREGGRRGGRAQGARPRARARRRNRTGPGRMRRIRFAARRPRSARRAARRRGRARAGPGAR
jgi:tetratricopeptide (TPR) repeat protein